MGQRSYRWIIGAFGQMRPSRERRRSAHSPAPNFAKLFKGRQLNISPVAHFSGRNVLAIVVAMLTLWAWVALLTHFFLAEYEVADSLLKLEIAATISTLLFWAVNTDKAYAPIKLLDNFLVLVGVVPIAVLFIEMDCGWTLHYVARSLSCAHYGGGLSVIFTLAAVAIVVAVPPTAVRDWVLNYRSNSGNRT